MKDVLMSEKAVILDTNVYRAMSYDANGTLLSVDNVKERWRQVKEQERLSGVRGYCNLFVIIELFAHLANISDPAYEACKRAVVGAVEHCTDNDAFRLLVDGESNLCQILFGQVSEVDQGTTEQIMTAASMLYVDSSESNMTSLRTIFLLLADHVEIIERQFLGDMNNYVVLALGGEAGGWSVFEGDRNARQRFVQYIDSDIFFTQWAGIQVTKAALALGQSIAQVEDVSSKVTTVKSMYKSPFSMYKEIVKKMASGGYNLEKKGRSNSVWDMQVMFSFCENGDLDGRETVLVTDDKLMRVAATSVGLDGRCVSSRVFFDSIGAFDLRGN
jgi:hypothetical protein